MVFNAYRPQSFEIVYDCEIKVAGRKPFSIRETIRAADMVHRAPSYREMEEATEKIVINFVGRAARYLHLARMLTEADVILFRVFYSPDWVPLHLYVFECLEKEMKGSMW